MKSMDEIFRVLREVQEQLAAVKGELAHSKAEKLAVSFSTAATMLDRSKKTVERMVKAGVLLTIDDGQGGDPLIPMAELKRFTTPREQPKGRKLRERPKKYDAAAEAEKVRAALRRH